MSDKFEFYDNDAYEDKLIFNLVFEEKFLDTIYPIIEGRYFNGKHRKWLVNHIKQYYDKYAKPITYESVLIELRRDNWINQDKNKAVMVSVIKLARQFNEPDKAQQMLKDSEIVQEYAQQFCKTKRYVEAILECSQMVGTDRESEIPSVISQTEMITDPIHLGTDFFDMEARRKHEPREDVIPTPWKAVNDYIEGVGRNELACWIAGMGAGKSTHASNLALHGVKQGYNVVLYSLELGEMYNMQRVDSIFLGKKSDEIETSYDELEAKIKQLKNNGGSLTIKKFPSGITANTIKNHFKRLRAKKLKPDLFIIDYIDLMDSIYPIHNKKQEWEKFGEVTKEIRNEICFNENIAGHAFVQGNTSAIQEFVIRADSSSGGAKRLFPADIVIGLARPDELKAQEKIHLSLVKSRFSEDGFYLKGTTNYSLGQVEYHEGAHYNLHRGEEEHTEKSIKKDYKEKFRTQANKPVQQDTENTIFNS